MDRRKSIDADSAAGATDLAEALDFTIPVGPNGYAWWYLDAISDDGADGLTVIAFIGSVFSPYYAWARRRGEADPENHVALNVALYGIDRRGRNRWAMTERGRGALSRTGASLGIGPSVVTMDGGSLVIEIDEWTVPWPSRLRGRVRVTPVIRTAASFPLDAAGRHRWFPLAPRCRVEVEMEQPARRWSGEGYVDRNWGARPLEADFAYWDWSRANLAETTTLLYDVVRRDGSEHCLALTVDRSGAVGDFVPPARTDLARNNWLVPRRTRGEADARLVKTLEDTPFYSRSIIETRLLGEELRAMHESLALDRFERGIVQMMLPFRMPRWR